MGALSDEVASRVDKAPESGAPGIDEPFYELVIEEGSNPTTIKSAFQSVAFSGWRRALLATKNGDLILSALIPLPPNHPEAKRPSATMAPVFLALHADKTELWLGDEKDPAKSPLLSATWATANVSQAGLTELRNRCNTAERCHRIAFQVADDVPVTALLRTFESVASLCRETGGGRCELGFRIRPPEPRGKPPTFFGGVARVGDTRVSGRLPPAVVQATVRAAAGQMRACYLAGLARNPELRGKVVVRFVIGRDGKTGPVLLVTKEAESSANSPKLVTDMADSKVSDCVLGVYRGLRFPLPEGGIVTVVYPIEFAPDE